MVETIQLREKPELKIILNDDSFEVIDTASPRNNGVYAFHLVKDIQLNEENTNWFVTIFSWFVGGITSSSVEGNFKDKANLRLKLSHRTLKIWLNNADFYQAKRIVRFIGHKTTSS